MGEGRSELSPPQPQNEPSSNRVTCLLLALELSVISAAENTPLTGGEYVLFTPFSKEGERNTGLPPVGNFRVTGGGFVTKPSV